MATKKKYPVFRLYEYSGYGSLQKVNKIKSKNVFEHQTLDAAEDAAIELMNIRKPRQLVIVAAERNTSAIVKIVTPENEQIKIDEIITNTNRT